jgi:hypothetical protein
MKQTKIITKMQITIKTILFIACYFGLSTAVIAQSKLPLIKASNEKAIITDGENVKIEWKLDPKLKPDIYFVNIPLIKSKVSLKTDQDEISFQTKPGGNYDFIVLLNEMDSCYVRISSCQPPASEIMNFDGKLPESIPFSMKGSRIYFKGKLNGKLLNIQLDLGAGTNVVNKLVSDTLGLTFSQSTLVSNTEGVNEQRTSINNELKLGDLSWSGISVTEVGNMQPYEDMIIGNGLFRDKIIELDYDSKNFTIHDKLPSKAKTYSKQPVYYEQNRPKFEAEFVHNGKKFDFWFLFDTGRDGTMLIGENFTALNNNWIELNPLMTIKGRKIVCLDAIIAGQKFSDIVTNAADPSNPQGRPTLFGNQILSHFNIILDNRSGIIYLKANSRTNEPYSDYKGYLEEVSKMQKK